MDKLLEQIKQKEIEKYNEQIKNLQNQIEELENSRVVISTKEFSNAYRLLHPFKYRKEKRKQELDIYINEGKNIELDGKIADVDREIKRINKLISNPLEHVDLSSEEAIVLYCNQNNIEIKFDSNLEALQSMPRYFGNNVEFMKKAVLENPLYSCFDKTNDFDLLKITTMQFVKTYKDSLDGRVSYDNYVNLLNVLNRENLSLEDKKLCVYFFELIKTRSTERLREELVDKDHIRRPIPMLDVTFDEIKELYETPFAKQMEEIYTSNKYIIGLHGTFTNFGEKDNSVFRGGLKNSTQTGAVRALDRTVAYNIPFLHVINYDAGIYGASNLSGAPYNYVILLPKDLESTPVWGSDYENSDENYLLPEYIAGYYLRGQGKDTKMILNTEENKKIYPYLFIDKTHTPILNEEKNVSL